MFKKYYQVFFNRVLKDRKDTQEKFAEAYGWKQIWICGHGDLWFHPDKPNDYYHLEKVMESFVMWNICRKAYESEEHRIYSND